ncbi:hypothetical protein J7E88_07890 [Streptomyces sp. ISL-10]|uniref:hypothetical protein n=1 Tax=Streptomyces sp. ISL-10 TaxID=2819172 RepID=UPI001BE5FBD0|nr:hypothetical protein [Streptomyces sp. ISL-10]MBT2365243.1 hypothetical protein [Streptomyces sp. ISL-10]
MKYCLVGRVSGEILTYQGYALVHDNKSELEYLFPNERIIPLPRYYGEDLTMDIRNHPDMTNVKFPLADNWGQFRR